MDIHQNKMPSIYELAPLEQGGRIARQGFDYQDHVGASFCLDMLENIDLTEVWFEKHDDISLIWNKDGIKYVEFVQVKFEDRASRWSISALTQRDKKNNQLVIGTSLLEKSLNHSRCIEKTIFRIVTRIDVDVELSVLKNQSGGKERIINQEIINTLANNIVQKLGVVSTSNGTTVYDWVNNCFWDKRPDSVSSIRNENRLRLEELIRKKGNHLAYDQRDEIYTGLLALVSQASSADLSVNPIDYRISRSELEKWIIGKINNNLPTDPTTNKLATKMERAGIPKEAVESAKEIRRSYLKQRLVADYIQSSNYEKIESEITTTLQYKMAELDSGIIPDNGILFHAACLKKINEIFQKFNSIPESFLVGYMYERTNRCVHRFDRAKP